MKLILTQDVKGLGKKESVVEVSDGYARNFLLPKGLALEANSSNMNVLTSKKSSEARKKENEIKEAKTLVEKIGKLELVIKTKAGENGRLFGSITNKDIGEQFKKVHGINIDKKKIELEEPIKQLGNYWVEMKVYSGISAKLRVKIEADN